MVTGLSGVAFQLAKKRQDLGDTRTLVGFRKGDIKNETLTAKLEFVDVIDIGTEIEFDDIATKLCIKKH